MAEELPKKQLNANIFEYLHDDLHKSLAAQSAEIGRNVTITEFVAESAKAHVKKWLQRNPSR